MAKKRRPASAPSEDALSLPDFRQEAGGYLDTINTEASTKRERAAQLRAYHALGGLIERFCQGQQKGAMERIAPEVGKSNPGSVYPIRHFAQRYTKGELEELCRHADSISFGHVVRLLPLEKNRRRAFSQKIVDEGWGVRKLQNALKPSHLSNDKAVRGKRIPQDTTEAALWLAREAQHWTAASRLVREKLDEAGSTEERKLAKHAGDIVPALKELLKEARATVRHLEKLVGNES